MKILNSYWFLFGLAIALSLGTSEVLLFMFVKQANPAKHFMKPVAKEPTNTAFWSFRSREIEKLVSNLKTEQKEIKERETGMLDMENRVRAEKKELNDLRQNIVNYRKELSSQVIDVESNEKKNLQELAQTYSTMKPDEVVKIFAELDDVMVIKILTFMNSDTIGPIFSKMTDSGESKRVANLSKLIRLRQKK